MSELKSAFATNFAPLGTDAACQLTIEHVSKTTKQVGDVRPMLPESIINIPRNQIEESLCITIPDIFTSFEVLVATDKEGVLLRSAIEQSQDRDRVINVSLDKTKNNTMAFVNVKITHPERRDIVRFVNLNQIEPPHKYQGILDLLTLVDRKLGTSTFRPC
jgi:hypothetical protein